MHLVSFNVPYPPNYGGVIDVYYKVKALTAAGIPVTLHTYQYGRDRSEVLEKLCHKVFYYKRHIYRDPFFSRLPYIVASRNSAELLHHLLEDEEPILFEGLHCCYYLSHPALKERQKIVRMHNIEHIYYKHLCRIEKNLLKKYFFAIEAERLRQFEKKLSHAQGIAAISTEDCRALSVRYENVFYLPVFHPNQEVTSNTGTGSFALYHGNLAVGENNEAALYLVSRVFKGLDYPLVIAGMNPSKELKREVEGKRQVTLLDRIDTHGISRLIEQAHINILPTFQQTGMKLKLLNVLYQGRHCIVNSKMVGQSSLRDFCHVADTPEAMRQAILRVKDKPFEPVDIQRRAEFLHDHFGPDKSIQILLEQLEPVRIASWI